RAVAIMPRNRSHRSVQCEVSMRASLLLRIVMSAKQKGPGSLEWKFFPEKFIHSGTVDHLASSPGGTTAFSRRSACGQSNGRARVCLHTAQKVSTCIRPAFPEM